MTRRLERKGRWAPPDRRGRSGRGGGRLGPAVRTGGEAGAAAAGAVGEEGGAAARVGRDGGGRAGHQVRGGEDRDGCGTQLLGMLILW